MKTFALSNRWTSAGMLLCALVLIGGMTGCTATPKRADSPDPGPLALEVPLETFTLRNGMRVLLAPRRMTGEFSAKLVFFPGVQDEPYGKQGIRRIVFYCMVHSYRENAQTCERAGIWYDPLNIQPHLTALDLVGDSNNLEVALRTYARMFAPDRIREESFANAKAETLEMLERAQGRAGEGESIDPLLYHGPDEPYGRPRATLESVAALTIDDARWFRENVFNPAGALICIMGDYDAGEVRGLLEDTLGALPSGPAVQTDWKHPPVRGPETRRVEGKQPGLVVAWETPGIMSEDAALLELASEIFSREISQRLATKHGDRCRLRGAGWQSRWGPSFLVASLGTSPHDFDLIEADVIAIAKEISEEVVADEDVKEIQSRMMRSAMLYYFRAPYLESWWHPAPMREFFAGDLDHVGKYNRMMCATPEQIRAVLAKYLRDAGRVTIRVSPEQGS